MAAELCCVLCGDDEAALLLQDGAYWCDPCIERERTADIEGYEERRRAWLAEEQEC